MRLTSMLNDINLNCEFFQLCCKNASFCSAQNPHLDDRGKTKLYYFKSSDTLCICGTK